jgi:hypothetical protein
MKAKLLVFMLALVTSAGTLFAESGTCGDNATWNYTDSVLTISGTGAMTDYAAPNTIPWSMYRWAIHTIHIGDSITHIGNNAFVMFSSLRTVAIGSGVESIGIHAFYHAANVTELVLPASLISIGVQAFSGWGGLTELVLPESLTTLGDLAFSGCQALTSINIPASVTSIAEDCFENCSSITAFNVDAANPNYASADGVLFDKEKATLLQYPISKPTHAYTIPSTVTKIANRAVWRCDSLTTVSIPASVDSIGEMNFNACYALTEIIVDDANSSYSSVDGVLFNKEKTTLVCFPAGIISDEYTVPASVTTVGDVAFADCFWLTTVVVPNTVASIGEYAFNFISNVIYSGPATGAPWGALYMNGYVDKPLIFSDETKTHLVGCAHSFEGEIVIPASVTEMEEGAFMICIGITSVVIPDSITLIPGLAFEECRSLTSVTIPASVDSIGYAAFSGCTALTTVTCHADTPPACGEYVFSSVDKDACQLFVPENSLEAYRNAETWQDFTTILPIESQAIEQISALQNDNRARLVFLNGQLLIQTSLGTFNVLGQLTED